MPAAYFLHRFSVCHSKFVGHIKIYIKKAQALYVDTFKWGGGGAHVAGSAGVTEGNHPRTDTSRVVFKLFGKKVAEFNTKMRKNHFFHHKRRGRGCSSASHAQVPREQLPLLPLSSWGWVQGPAAVRGALGRHWRS